MQYVLFKIGDKICRSCNGNLSSEKAENAAPGHAARKLAKREAETG